MTIMGLHTVAETRDLIRFLEFRINQNMKQWELIKTKRLPPATGAQRQLDDDIVVFMKRWVTVRDESTLIMLAAVLANPSVAPFLLPAEQQFVAVDEATRRDNPRLMDIQGRIDEEAHQQNLPSVDLSKIPPQNSPDTDFEALRKLDAAIKDGEEAAAKAAAKAKDAAKSNVGLIIGAVGVGVVGVVVATKVYL